MGWGIEVSDEEGEDLASSLTREFRKNISEYPSYLKDKIKETLDEDEKESAILELGLIQAREQFKDMSSVRFSDVVHIISMEYSETGTFIVIVPFSEVYNFHRHDDPIDYHDFDDSLNIDDGPFVQHLNNGIFPYNDGYVDKRTQKSVSNNTIKVLDFMSEHYQGEASNDLYRKYGFNSLEEYKENVVPVVPFSVRNIVDWLKVFNKNPEMVNELRPMLLTYWL